jgi:hypothetical protein
MLSVFLRSSGEVVQVCEDDMSQIVKMYVMVRWKVAPTFLRPKGMPRYEKVLHGVVNVVLY